MILLAEHPSEVLAHMPMPGYIGESGRQTGFSSEGLPPGRFVELVVGKNGEYARRIAMKLTTLRPDRRWIQTGGHFGVTPAGWHVNDYRMLLVEALIVISTECKRAGVTPAGIWIDNEDDRPNRDKAIDLKGILFDSGVFDRRKTRALGWAITNGRGPMRNEWGAVAKAPPIDGRTTLCHCFLDFTRPDIDAQVDDNIKQVAEARAADHYIGVLVSGALHGQTWNEVIDGKRVPREHRYTKAEVEAWARMAKGIRRQSRDTGIVIVHNLAGHGIPVPAMPFVPSRLIDGELFCPNHLEAAANELATAEAFNG